MSLVVISTSNAFKASSGSASETDSPDCSSFRLVQPRHRWAHFRSGRRRRRHGRRRRRSRRRSRSRRKRGRDAAERCCGYGHGDERLQRLRVFSFQFSIPSELFRCAPSLGAVRSPQVVIPCIRRLKRRIRKTAGNKAPTGAGADGRVCGYVHVRRYADVHVFHCASVRMRNCVCVRVCVCAIAEPTGAYRNRACPDPGECCRS